MFLFYKDIILNANNYLFSIEGDGLKNYFNFLYHIKFDRDYSSFNGMNYPYGESIAMVDCHPLLATNLKFISQNYFDISPYAVGLLNLLMFSSLVTCSVFVYLILNYYKLPQLISMGGGIAVSFLSSNALLWEHGHYALSYSCFFPMGWYLILKFQASENKIYYSTLILLNSLFWFYTHTYLGLILVGFTFLTLFFSSFFYKNYLNFKTLLILFIQVIFPLSIIYLILILTDNHIGRMDMPPVYNYKASIYSVLLPNHSYLRPLYDLFLDLTPQKKESWCNIGNYIGLSTNLIISFTSFYFLFNLIIKRKWMGSFYSKNEWIALISAIVLLLYAMAIPFYYNMEFLRPDIIKQFIALGRFAWPFYFVSIIISLITLFKIFESKRASIIATICILLLCSEGFSYHYFLRKNIKKQNPLTSYNFENLTNTLESEKYQAVLGVPFFHHYISLHSYTSSDLAEQLTMSFSYQTGLPLFNAILSRPSVLESKSIVQILTPSYYQKPILNYLNKKPILLLVSKKDNYSFNEQELINKAIKINSNEWVDIYELSVDSLKSVNTRKYLSEFLNNTTYQFDEVSGYYLNSNECLYYESFEERKNLKSYRGNGAASFLKNSDNAIFKSIEYQFDTCVVYNISFWYYNYIYDQSFNSIRVEVKDSSGIPFFANYLDPCKSNFYDGNWAYNSLVFELDDPTNYIELYSSGADLFADSIYIDELLIRPNHSIIYKPIQMNTASPDTIVIRNNETILLR